MGGQLSAMAPTQIHPVEYYLSDLSNSEFISFDINLGSTRFFKVARVKLHQARPITITGSKQQQQLNYTGFGPPSLGVAKVFVINDPSLPLKAYKDILIQLKESLEGNPNVLPFSRIILSDKSGILLRQFIKYNLYDRLSTRPYLTFFEKKWITFQLLKCFQWCHQRCINHADVKLENILITSFNWILVTDFAPFKPTKVPEDNPSDFSFYFDTSRRRCCNLAPERFVLSEEAVPSGDNNSNSLNSDNLRPQMDLFSLGCVLAELFAESNDFSLFDLSSILLYKKHGVMAHKLENVIADEEIRSLINNLIQVDPDLRYSTTQHIKSLTPNIFPNYFNQVFDYFKQLMNYSSDGKIIKLSKDLPSLIALMKEEDSTGLILLLVQLTSTLRSLKHVDAKITALRLIQTLILSDSSVNSNLVIDRVLPHLLNMAKDASPRVKAEAISVMTTSMSIVDTVQASDANIFADYILPVINKIASATNDKSVLAKLAIGSNLASFSEVASKIFYQHRHLLSESEEKLLKESFAVTISSLLTDRSNAVKIQLLSSNVSKLAVFLGKSKANDVILSHIITFLNDKSDHELRAAFFDHIVSIVSVLGESTSSILKPLLSQGLVDTNESVIVKTINAISCLSSLKILEKSTLFDLITESIPFLYHPSFWVMDAEVNLVINFSKSLSLAEISCKLMPIINKFTIKEMVLLEKDLLLDNVKTPIKRNIYNLLISVHTPLDQLETLFNELENKQLIAALPPFSRRPLSSFGPASTPSLSASGSLYQRIMAEIGTSGESINPDLEEQLYCMANLITRINRNIKSSIKRSGVQTPDGMSNIIDLDAKKHRRVNSTNLIDEEKMIKTRIRSMTSDMNNEWRQMFGSISLSDSLSNNGNNDNQQIVGANASTISNIVGDNNNFDTTDNESLDGIIIPVASEAKELSEEDQNLMNGVIKCPPCVTGVKELIDHKKDDYEYYLWSRGIDGSTPGSPCEPKTGYIVHNSVSNTFKPKRCLIAHIFEHLKGVNRLTVIQNTPLFASASSDGYIKIWESHKIESGSMPINKSRQSLASHDLSGFEGLTYCAAVDSLIAYTINSSLHVFHVENGGKMKSMDIKTSNDVHKQITDVICSSAFSFITSFSDSTLYEYDLRMSLDSVSWKLDTDLKDGFITSITATDYVLFAATSSGIIYTFDTRFLMRSLRVEGENSSRKRIRRLLYTGNNGSSNGGTSALYAAVKGNNEVSVFDPESGVRSKVFWASKVPILSATEATSDSVLSMVSLQGTSNALITAGTDMRIRYWDLDNIERSFVMSDGYLSSSGRSSSFSYETKITEGIEVFHESIKQSHSPVTDNGMADPNLVSPAHRDGISDMVWVEASKVLVSSSLDGVIKVWK